MCLTCLGNSEEKTCRVSGNDTLKPGAGLGPSGNRQQQAKAQNKNEHALFGEGGYIWHGVTVKGNETFKEGRTQCRLSYGCQALGSELDPRGVGDFQGFETGMRLRVVCDSDPPAAAWGPKYRRQGQGLKLGGQLSWSVQDHPGFTIKSPVSYTTPQSLANRDGWSPQPATMSQGLPVLKSDLVISRRL